MVKVGCDSNAANCDHLEHIGLRRALHIHQVGRGLLDLNARVAHSLQAMLESSDQYCLVHENGSAGIYSKVEK